MTMQRRVAMLVILFQQNLVTFREPDKAVLVLESFRRVAQGEERDDTAGQQSEHSESQEVGKGGLHGQRMPELRLADYSCRYANDLSENQWVYAPSVRLQLSGVDVLDFTRGITRPSHAIGRHSLARA